MKSAYAKTGNAKPSPATERSDSSLSALLLEAQDEERRKISRELHDGVGQSLAAVKMTLGKLKKKLSASELNELIEAERVIDEAVTEVRTVSYLLHPPTLDLMGLRSSIIWFVEGFQQRTGIQCSLEIPATLPLFEPMTRTALFRIVQESLTNVHKHAQASNVTIRITVDSDEFKMELTDDGVGFCEGCLEGVGIRGMRERVKELNGSLYLESHQGVGSSVVAVIPAAADHTDFDTVSEGRIPSPSPVGHLGRILLVDDHEMLRRGVRSLIDGQPGMAICGEAATSREGLEQLEKLRPDVTILDLQLPDENGWAFIRQARKMSPLARIIVFSQHDGEHIQSVAKVTGCSGFVSKSRASEDLIEAICAVLAGETFFDSKVRSASA